MYEIVDKTPIEFETYMLYYVALFCAVLLYCIVLYCTIMSKSIRYGRNPSVVVKIYQILSKSIRCGQNPSGEVKIHQRWSESIRGGQNSSRVSGVVKIHHSGMNISVVVRIH